MPRIKYYDIHSETWKYADKVINGSSGQGYNVQFVKQGLNPEQMAQARENIGAASQEEVSEIVDEVLGSGALLKTTDVVDNLTTTSTDKPLSANQGKVLNESISSVSQIANDGKDLGTAANTQAQTNKNNIESLNQSIININNSLSDYAPKYTYGMDDLEAGSSPLETGKLYFVYE